MYVNSEFSKVPSFDAPLWRYMDLPKYAAMLDTQCLFFPRVDKLDDPFEGSLPSNFAAKHPRFFESVVPLAVEQKATFTELPKFTMASCWHCGDHESDAMWRLYSPESYGIAVKTDLRRLRKSLVSNNAECEFFAGMVNYVDYDTFGDDLDGSIEPYFLKRIAFEHEREFRIITQPKPELDGYPGKPDLSQPITEHGWSYKVDVAFIIQEVVVAPLAPAWYFDIVRSVTARYGYDIPIRKSTLAQLPRWGSDPRPGSEWRVQDNDA